MTILLRAASVCGCAEGILGNDPLPRWVPRSVEEYLVFNNPDVVGPLLREIYDGVTLPAVGEPESDEYEA